MPDVFREAMLELMPKLRAYAVGLTGSTVEADDLVQDALMRAWRFRDRFAPGSNQAAWMFRILRNEFLTQLTSRRATVQDIDGHIAGQLSCAPNQEWRVQYCELLDALPLLSADTRDALLLVVGSGLSYEDAASVCGCEISAMKGRVRRARLRLAELIDFDASEPARRPRATAGVGHAASIASIHARTRA
jgi:RNA polymerase sigma-70 factor (ECF subfamily)